MATNTSDTDLLAEKHSIFKRLSNRRILEFNPSNILEDKEEPTMKECNAKSLAS